MDYDETLNLAIQRCEQSSYYDWQSFFNIYPFTTENITGYINYFDLKNKSLLTVGSSCDQTLNAILMGCNDITLLDINPFVKYYYYLKMCAILELDMNEFFAFFRYKNYPLVFEDNKNVFNINVFNRIKSILRLLNYEAYLFWDELFQIYSPLMVRDCLFSMDEHHSNTIIESNYYLHNSEYYNLLKNRILKVKPLFINGDILSFETNKQYDNIWLSNIPTYFGEKNMLDVTINKYYQFLKDNGLLLYGYLYQTNGKNDSYYNNYPLIYNFKYLFDKYKEFNPEVISFTGVFSILHNIKSVKDAALILRK